MKKLVFGVFFFVSGYILFSLVFVRVGYHPYSLRIQGAKRSLDQAVSSCYTSRDDNRTTFMVCAQKKLLTAVRMWGLRPLMDAIEKKQRENTGENQAITQCHDLTHAIGAAGLIVMKDLNTTLLSCTNTCVYGCQHGVISAWYSMGKDILGKLPGICVEGIDWSKLPYGQNGCFHEIGHAVANIAGYDVEKALQLCDKVSQIGRVDCAHGVFMEAYEPATFTTSILPMRSDYVEWCGTLRDPYKQICYDKAGANVYGRTRSDSESFAMCEKIPSALRSGCVTALGQNIFYVYQREKNQAENIIEFCKKGNALFSYCIDGALSSSSVSQPDALGGSEICALFSGAESVDCARRFGNIIRQNHTSAQSQSICKKFTGELQKACL